MTTNTYTDTIYVQRAKHKGLSSEGKSWWLITSDTCAEHWLTAEDVLEAFQKYADHYFGDRCFYMLKDVSMRNGNFCEFQLAVSSSNFYDQA